VRRFSHIRRAPALTEDGTGFGNADGMTFPVPARVVGLVVSLFLLQLATPAWSQEGAGFAKEGGYVGASGLLDFSFGGETFDGESIYRKVGGDEIMILPKLEGARNSLRAVAGIRSARGAFEFSYDQTRHHGTFLGETGEATFHAINLDERIYFLTRTRIQPHVLVGGSIPWLTIKDGSFLDPSVGDASFRGFGVNTEAGVTVYPHPRFGISTGYRYRLMWFDHASGVSDTSYNLRPRFRETSGSVVITGLFTF
jgi:hypothetical protein